MEVRVRWFIVLNLSFSFNILIGSLLGIDVFENSFKIVIYSDLNQQIESEILADCFYQNVTYRNRLLYIYK